MNRVVMISVHGCESSVAEKDKKVRLTFRGELQETGRLRRTAEPSQQEPERPAIRPAPSGPSEPRQYKGVAEEQRDGESL